MELEESILKAQSDDFYNLVLKDSLESTNTYLKDNYKFYPDNTVLVAKEQTKGRGRLSKGFHSPGGSGLYFTLLLKNPVPRYETGYLTMTAAVAVNEALSDYSKDTGIKWVNDIFMGGKKVCGILTEAVFEEGKSNPSAVLIGIGINVNTKDFPPELKNTASSMALNIHENLDLNEVLVKVLERLKNKLGLLAFDKSEITKEYEKHLLFKNEEVKIINSKKIITGTLLGINESGYLRIFNKDSGAEEIIYTGELKKEDNMKKFTFDVPTRILLGPGALNELGGQKLPGTKALIVITKGASVKRMGYLDRTVKELERAGLASVIFDEVNPNPTLENVTAGAEKARENSCDLVVGLGGGSAIDAAKAIAFSATNPGNYWDYMVMGKGGKKKQENTPLPIIAITTTSGTGTEANQVSVITNEENLEKLGYFNDSLYPVISVVDSELMASVPPVFTAYQGFDALFHAVESYLNVNSHPMVELYALKAVEYVAGYLPRAVEDGSDKEARYYMSLASTYAGIFMMTLSAHGIEHSLSAFYPNLPHGAGLMLISRDYHDMHIKKGGAPEKYIKLAKAMGAQGNVVPEDFSSQLNLLMERCKMENISMKSFGITRENLLPMTENAMEIFHAKFLIDPTKLSKDEVLEILTKSFNRN